MFDHVRCETKQEAQVPKSGESVLLRQRQVLYKLNFFLICVSEKCCFCVRMEDMCLVKNGSSVYLSHDGAKELVIICEHVHFSHKNKWTYDCVLSPKLSLF